MSWMLQVGRGVKLSLKLKHHSEKHILECRILVVLPLLLKVGVCDVFRWHDRSELNSFLWMEAHTGCLRGNLPIFQYGDEMEVKRASMLVRSCTWQLQHGGGHGLLNTRSAGIIGFNDRLTLWQSAADRRTSRSVAGRPAATARRPSLKRREGEVGSKVMAGRSGSDGRLSWSSEPDM